MPKLLTLSSQIAERSHGKVKVTADGVLYKGLKIDNVLTAKIMELIEHNQPVAHMLRFMDNLYQQPDVSTVNQVYEWLSSGRFALTEDGCFLAYKVVNRNYRDKYTNTVDNHIGSRPLMARSEVDPNPYNECSYGYHFCSRGYIPAFYSEGDHIMLVKVNPADVVAIPRDYEFKKGRTWTYEVMDEVHPDALLVSGVQDAPVMMQPVIEYAGDRQALIKQVKALPTVQRMIRKKQLTRESFNKASVERLKGWLRKFSRMDIAPAQSKLFDNPLRFAREAAGLTMGQVAKAAEMKLSDVYNAERCQRSSLSQEVLDKVLIAIAKLQGNTQIREAGVSYPRPSLMNTRAAYTAQVAPSVPKDASEEDEDWDEDDWDEDED